MNLGARSLHQLARHFSTNSPGFIGIRQLQQAEDWSALATDAVAKYVVKPLFYTYKEETTNILIKSSTSWYKNKNAEIYIADAML